MFQGCVKKILPNPRRWSADYVLECKLCSKTTPITSRMLMNPAFYSKWLCMHCGKFLLTIEDFQFINSIHRLGGHYAVEELIIKFNSNEGATPCSPEL